MKGMGTRKGTGMEKRISTEMSTLKETGVGTEKGAGMKTII